MRPFSEIRLAYLDELEGDPEVVAAVERGAWVQIKKAGGYKFEKNVDEGVLENGGVKTTGLAYIAHGKQSVGDALLEMRPNYKAHIYPNDYDMEIFYNKPLDYIFYYKDLPHEEHIKPRIWDIMQYVSSNPDKATTGAYGQELRSMGIE